MKKGKIPVTKTIELNSIPDQWRLIENNVINEHQCVGIVEQECGTKIKVSLTITHVASPQKHSIKTIARVRGNKKEEKNIGIGRIEEFLSTMINKKICILSGYLKGDNTVPILIIYYELLNISIYTIKFKREDSENFFPVDIPLPSAN